MMHYTYILQSEEQPERHYIGSTDDLKRRFAEPRYITFTEKPGSGLTKELADTMWTTLCSWIEPQRQDSGPVTFRKCQRLVSPELQRGKADHQLAERRTPTHLDQLASGSCSFPRLGGRTGRQ